MDSGKIQTLKLLTALLCILAFFAQPAGSAIKDPNSFLKADPNDIAAWRAMKFGITFSWGPSSLIGTEMSWSRAGKRGNYTGTGSIPVEVYDNLYRSWYPAQFDANQWVDIAKAAGAKYVIFITKHHDGFAMFDSVVTDYKITNSPFKHDVIRDLADACHKTNLKLGFYHSQPDWHHPDYQTAEHSKYIRYLHSQMQELCSKYGKIDIFCFDGLRNKAETWDAANLFKIIRRFQPHIVINNRAGLAADYETPEQYAGSFQAEPPWESWITISEQWAYKSNDQLKTLKQCIESMVKVVGSDGNFNLSIGPMPTGEIEPAQVERLKEIGNWLNKYGQSIYATRGGPFKPGLWGASTYKDNITYLHIISWQDFPPLLPPIGRKIISSEILTGSTVEIKQNKSGISVSTQKQYQNDIDTIIKLTLDGPANKITPVVMPSGSLAAHKPIRTSNKTEKSGENVVDDDFSTWWTADVGAKQSWLEVDLGKDIAFNRVLIHEANSPWFQYIEKFELQYKTDGGWKNILQGEKIGPDYCKQFDPVTARFIRLNITQAKDAPSIWEFQLFAPRNDKELKK